MRSVIDEEEQNKKKVAFYLFFCFSPKKVPAEADRVADVFAAEANSEISLPEISQRRQYRQYPYRPQCRFAGCGK